MLQPHARKYRVIVWMRVKNYHLSKLVGVRGQLGQVLPQKQLRRGQWAPAKKINRYKGDRGKNREKILNCNIIAIDASVNR